MMDLRCARLAGVFVRHAAAAALLLGISLPLFAQRAPGPITPPASSAPPSASPQNTPAPTAPAAKNPASTISTASPSMPVEQIIQQFAARESEFKRERDNFTYSQTFLVQEIDDEGRPDGEYRMNSDIIFTPEGKRIEHVTFAPQNTLKRLELSQEDLDDLEHTLPFALTTEDLPRYDVKYVGHDQVDAISAYVFDVAPKALEKGRSYFKGRIWVDDKDLEIVKTFGQGVHLLKKNSDQLFPQFETFRENIESNYWFPVYTRADDTLHFKTGEVRMRMMVRYSNYKRFGATIKIGKPTKVEPDKK